MRVAPAAERGIQAPKEQGARRHLMTRRVTPEDLQAWKTQLKVGDKKLPWVETKYFGINDPWSLHTRKVIGKLVARKAIREDHDLLEAGVGDTRNLVTAGFGAERNHDTRVIGVDVDRWRLDVGHANYDALGIPHEKRFLHEGNIIDYLRNDLPIGERLTGWGIACLPQAPSSGAESTADGYDENEASLAFIDGMTVGGRSVGSVGLKLNAAYLTALRDQVKPNDFNLLLTLSDRVPPEMKNELFEKTGWRVVEEFRTEEPVQQDPDTGVSFVLPFDDGMRFYEKNGNESFSFISAVEAESRRAASMREDGGGRESLDVHHHVTVHWLVPADIPLYEAN